MQLDELSRHVVVIFHNVGGYHAARLRAAHIACQKLGWNLTAVQVIDQTKEHPWGNVEQEITFPLRTLIPADQTHEVDCRPDSPAAIPPLSRCLNELKPDVLVIPGWGFPVSKAALRWAKQHHIPTILMSESKWDDEKRSWWKELLKSWLYVKKYDAALVGGKTHRDYLVQLGFPSDRIFFGYDVVDNSYFIQQSDIARSNPNLARQRQPKIPVKPYFLVVTRLIPRKNVARLVKAYAAYRQQIGQANAWDLVICGSGSEEGQIRQFVQDQSLNTCVHFPGFVTYQQIGDWYGLASAFVHPALQEQWGLVMNEACSAGLPILCSQTVGACELVRDQHNGFIFAPTSQAEMMRSLLNMHQLDPETRLQFGTTSRSLVADYTPESFGAGLLDAIKASLNYSHRF